MKKSLKGFTLVEVLIVIIIVGILIAALLPRLIGTQARARDTARNAHITQIAQGIALQRADFPSTTYSGCANGTTLIASGFISSIPTDPSNTAMTVGCTTAGQYGVFTDSTNSNRVLVYSQLERSVGNCTVSAAGTIPATNLTNGTHSCVVVQ